MQKPFSKILVPVVFNRNTAWAVEKAIHLANRFNCDILLLHVQGPSPAIPFWNKLFPASLTTGNDAREKIKELEEQSRPKLKEGLLLTSLIRTGHWQALLKDVIISEHIDLLLVPRNRRKVSSALIRKININRISQQTNCPVLTITRNFNIHHLHNIVVPVHDQLPVRKLTIATYLSLETSSCIYLMGHNSHGTAKKEEGYLMRAYQLLNDLGKLNIQCALRDSDESATGTLAYAKDVKANLIVINPGPESRLRGWWNKLNGKYLSRESDIPVLTVAL